ncbi:hypothetical protein LVJ94_07745 [Pendulispora rubella]|uniref:Uncharacterized protein n=1 Tax=Pendulispora rubella TaxID=2741070 RepID=A0ABZ2LBF1_9BACT
MNAAHKVPPSTMSDDLTAEEAGQNEAARAPRDGQGFLKLKSGIKAGSGFQGPPIIPRPAA